MSVRHLSDYNPDGNCLGQDASDKVSFFGATPIVRPSGSAQDAVSTAAITSVSTAAVTTAAGFYGFATAAQGNAILTAINSLITQSASLVTLANGLRSALSSASLGLIKGGA